MSDFPTFTLQRWDSVAGSWLDHGTFTSSRGEDNADYAVAQERRWNTGPIRLLKEGAEVFADDPATHGLTNF